MGTPSLIVTAIKSHDVELMDATDEWQLQVKEITCFDEDLGTHLKATPGTLPIDMSRKWKRVISVKA